MPEAIKANAATVIDENLVVMGGWIEGECLNNVWVLDTTDKNAEWIEKPKMLLPRGDFSIAKIGGRVLVCRGYSERMPMDDVEIFDGKDWKSGPKLITSTRQASAITIPMDLVKYI